MAILLNLLLTFQLGSQTLCKLLEADHDDPSKDFFDDGQKTEISISADGDFGEMKKTETPSKRRRESWQVCYKAFTATSLMSYIDRIYSCLMQSNNFVIWPHTPFQGETLFRECAEDDDRIAYLEFSTISKRRFNISFCCFL